MELYSLTMEKIIIGYAITAGIIPGILKAIGKTSDASILIITGFLVFFWTLYLVYNLIKSFYVYPQSSKYAEWV